MDEQERRSAHKQLSKIPRQPLVETDVQQEVAQLWDVNQLRFAI